MIEIIETKTFRRWRENLRDRHAKAIINGRLLRLARGLTSDIAPIGDGVSELRVHYGPGYRIYYLQRGTSIVILLCGGDKGSQVRDIRSAKKLAQEWRKLS
jgi:putative addiction module killer protein